MLTAGVDLASQAAGTAACTVEWAPGRAEVTSLDLGVGDEAILGLLGRAAKVGIDVPLGWPTPFVEAVAGHLRDGAWPAGYAHSRDTTTLRYRRTDLWVWRELGFPPPLSVSTDRLALPAMRAAALLAGLAAPVARDTTGTVVEAYPAAALRRWGFPSRRYKRDAHREARRALVADFRARTSTWLILTPGQAERCAASDDALDALLSALVARAAAQGLVEPVPEADRDVAAREGWIAVPLPGSLDGLAG